LYVFDGEARLSLSIMHGDPSNREYSWENTAERKALVPLLRREPVIDAKRS